MLAKLTDTSSPLLSAAAQRDDRAVVLPDRLKGNAAQKIAEKLIGLGVVDRRSAPAATCQCGGSLWFNWWRRQWGSDQSPRAFPEIQGKNSEFRQNGRRWTSVIARIRCFFNDLR